MSGKNGRSGGNLLSNIFQSFVGIIYAVEFSVACPIGKDLVAM